MLFDTIDPFDTVYDFEDASLASAASAAFELAFH